MAQLSRLTAAEKSAVASRETRADAGRRFRVHEVGNEREVEGAVYRHGTVGRVGRERLAGLSGRVYGTGAS
jgi:hypothetical protein